jgi:DNA-binding transcriptional MocR family regulator
MERNSFLIVGKAIAADTRLSATAKLLYAQLYDHRNKRTGQCNPKQSLLARELGISMDTVQRHLSQLRQHGFVVITRGQNGCRYEIPETATCGFPNRKNADGKPQNRGSDAPYPLYEPYVKNHSGVAAASSSQKQPLNASPPPRKSAQSETLEAYYREERRKAAKA